MIRYLPLITLLLLLPIPAPAQDTLTIWTRYDLADPNNPNAVTLAAQIATFEAATGIQVTHETVAWNQLATKLAIAAQSGGDVPDIIETGSRHIASLADIGALAPLDDLLADAAWTTDLTPADRAACIIDNVRYCAAHNVRGGITYYRTADFPNGFPTTPNQWLSVAPRLTGDNQFFSTQYAGRSYIAVEVLWFPLIHANGGTIFDSEGKPAWATEANVQVVNFVRTLFNEGYFPELAITGDFSDAEAPWIDGRAASFRGASWSPIFVPGLKAAVDDGSVDLAGGVDFGDGAAVFLLSEVWVIPATAANPDGAAQWLDQFFAPQFLAQWASTQYGVPTRESAQTLVDPDDPFFAAIDTILSEQGVFVPQSPYYIESLDELAVALQDLLLNPDLDPLQRLQAAEDAVRNRYW